MELYKNLSKLNELSEIVVEKANLCRSDNFSAKIKPELNNDSLIQRYILIEQVVTSIDHQNLNKNSENQVQNNEEDINENNKKMLEHSSEDHVNKKFKRGENKKNERKQFVKIREARLCPFIAKCIECEYGSKCTYNHDVKAYMENKQKDVSEICYLFEKYGKCPFGISCRFGSKHLEKIDDQNYKNLINEDIYSNDKTVPIYNVLNSDLRTKLWKKKYDFKFSDKIISKVNENRSTALKYHRFKGTLVNRNDEENKPEEKTKNEPRLGSITDEELIKMRTAEKKVIDWKNKLYLAPLTTVGNLPFRRICKEYGADITCSEMAMCTNLLAGQASEWALIKRHESEDLFGVQLAGAYPNTMTKACQLIKENFKVDFVDINSGCPIDLIFNKGAGCALMTRIDYFQKIIKSLNTLLDVPVTAKIRTGIKEDVFIANELVAEMKTWGVSMITLHGRTRQQRYSKLADWQYINDCAKSCDPVPLFGCGDILSYHDYNQHMQNSNISGCMIARGALYKPWLFTEIKEQRDWDISAWERFEMLKKFTNYGLEHWGSDSQGVETTRRFLLEWLSFLYRYIPIGILEQVPQHINQRPPFYFGRNDLESLMASPKSSDWIKLSEMLLGPVPEGFQFTPKHKANAY